VTQGPGPSAALEPSEPTQPLNANNGPPSFLPLNLLRRLQRQLDLEDVESEFDIKVCLACKNHYRIRFRIKTRL